MARVVATLKSGALQAPVLSSPELAVLSARRALALPEAVKATA